MSETLQPATNVIGHFPSRLVRPMDAVLIRCKYVTSRRGRCRALSTATGSHSQKIESGIMCIDDGGYCVIGK